MTRSEEQFQEWLEAILELEAINEYNDEENEPLLKHTRTFHHEGLLTDDAGLVIKLSNGKSFQVTIKEEVY